MAYTEKNIFLEDYVQLDFNGGTAGGGTTVLFSNLEIVSDVEYIPDGAPETITSQTGKTFASWKQQAEYFRVRLKYQQVATREKWETIRSLIDSRYALDFRLNGFVAPFSAWPLQVGQITPNENANLTARFEQAIIKLPEDTPFDFQARAQGVKRDEEIEFLVYRSLTLPVPQTECDALSLLDFEVENAIISGAELVGILIALNPSGLIQAITAYGAGILYKEGVQVSTMSWNAIQGRYEPDSAPFMLENDTNYTFTVQMNVTTVGGSDCTFTYSQPFRTGTVEATAPTANTLYITQVDSQLKEGSNLAAGYTYNDAENNAQDLSSTVVELWALDTNNSSSTGTKLFDLTHSSGTGTGNGVKTLDQVTIPASAIDKYIALKVQPVSDTAPTTGIEYWFIFDQTVVADIAAVVLPTDFTNPIPFEFSVRVKSGAGYYLEFSDNATPEYYEGNGNLNGHSHTFTTTSTPHTVTICCDPTDILGLTSIGSGLNGTVDLSQCTELDGVLDLNGNANLTACTLPTTGTPVLSRISLQNTGITGFDMGSVRGDGTNYLFLQNCTSLASFSQNTGVSDVLYLGIQLQSTLVTTVDVSNFNSAVLLAISANASLTSITYPTNNTTTVTSFQVHDNTNLTGTQDLSGCTGGFRGIFYAYNTDISAFTFPLKSVFDSLASSSLYITDFRVQNSNLSNPDFSNVTNLSGRVLLRNQILTTVTFSSSSYSGTFNEISIGTGRLSGTLDLSSAINWTGSGKIALATNPLLTSVTTPTMNTGAIQTLTMSSCGFTSAAGFGLSPLTLSVSAISFNFSGNTGLSSSEVDTLLATLDSKLTTGTGTIDLTNTSVPGTSGDASVASLALKGYTVLTD